MKSRVIQVSGKKLVMKVLLDEQGNYSVSGYAERMAASFGLIYLGRDKTDPDYELQAKASNRAIGMISEREAFSRALEATRAVMQQRRDAATFDMKDVSNHVLAALCTLWFDIPDGKSVVSSGWLLPVPPGRCPGQFAPPSGYIFQPEPNLATRWVGQLDGKLLHCEVAKFVATHRRSATLPNGELSKALFAAFPNSPADDDLLTRTLIGVMIGFLPTVQGNLMAAAQAWAGPKFDALRTDFRAHPESDLYLRAGQVIRGSLTTAMQQAPTPPAVWRTALQDHVLSESPLIQVKAGDRLAVNIDSATREDLAAGIADAFPIFGGDRSQNPHPTHACPGYAAGMGVLLGVIAGTLEAVPNLSSGWSIFKLLASFKKHWFRYTMKGCFYLVMALVVLGGITRKYQFWDNDPNRGAATVPQDHIGDKFDKVVYLKTSDQKWDQGWDPADSLWFYTTTQGSNLLPYDFFLALEQDGKPELFRDNVNMNRYRYLPQKVTPSNPDGLPVGFVKDTYQRKDYVGLTCAACHTAQLNYNGIGIRIDGGPAAADMQKFIKGLADAMRATLKDDKARERFVARVLNRDNNYAKAKDVIDDLNKYSHRIATYYDINQSDKPEYGYARLDAFGRIYNRILEHVLNSTDARQLRRLFQEEFSGAELASVMMKTDDILNGKRRDHIVERLATVLSPQEWTKVRRRLFNTADAPVSYPFVWDTPQHDYVQWNGLAANAVLGPVGRNTGEAIGVFGTQDWEEKSDWNVIGHFVAGVTGQGFFKNPYISFKSSIDVRNLHRLERHLQKLKSPQWPKEIIPLPADHVKRAENGKRLFNDYCAGCHAQIERADPDRRVVAHMSRLGDIRTDPTMAENGATRAGWSGILRNQYAKAGPGEILLAEQAPVAAILTKATVGVVAEPDPDHFFLTRVAFWAYDLAFALFSNEIKPSLKSGNYDPDTTAKPYDSLLAYKGRSLNGIWATAPYLHNGSVPTLYDLLLPKRKSGEPKDGEYRPDEFQVGSREFDAENVGLNSKGYDGYKFDTSAKGNSNAGHEYGAIEILLWPDGTTAESMTKEQCINLEPKGRCRVLMPLTKEQRRDLLAYLKTL